MISSPGDAQPITIGLCLNQPRRRVPMEPFWMRVIAGMEDALDDAGASLLVRVVADREEELATYTRWAGDGSVSAVVVANLVEDDPRIGALAAEGLPAVLMGRRAALPGFSSVHAANASVMTDVVRFLVSSGHQRIAHVAGPPDLDHVRSRNGALETAGAEARASVVIVESDFTAEGGAAATRDLLADGPDGPTAIVYDNDVMALAGLETIRAAGLQVPDDVSILAWDDSVHCQLASPPLSALTYDLPGYGRATATAILEHLATGAEVHVDLEPARLVERASTAARPRTA
ncbi:LacI family transcriptional regulator [Labedella gwakjiensis]|uniref:LacI family transcriptional regulator n=1 Tax=Labedella gwakjiensis TaxID=390269 RepID=A0A2P8GSS9_9MICO|nr:substrate-binding domain-containing protein [Labedella gwakjiensis]PSL37012.1 LacI family transcriptional regulator [Labedella gwakjiensis]RUQ81831.1 LacI family transcriptional regulator [Labedella gwakjiensis]